MRADAGAALLEIFDVRGVRTLITGGAGGIGLAIAEALLECGATVVVTDIQREKLAEAKSALSAYGERLQTRHLDVADPVAVAGVLTAVADELGGLDVVFANAGVPSSSRAQDDSDLLGPDWARMIDVNLTGAYATVVAAAQIMRRQGSGRIVITASNAGLRADPLVSDAYVASKAALLNLTRQVALRMAPHGVTVNALAPGPLHTGFGVADDVADVRARVDERFRGSIPLGRVGEPSDLRGVALLLASSASSYITGATITVDGGAVINYPVTPPSAAGPRPGTS
jgi:NAD(P)-dependent dehydrogenase (short-subunit alcohol dehydrogenase family)